MHQKKELVVCLQKISFIILKAVNNIKERKRKKKRQDGC